MSYPKFSLYLYLISFLIFTYGGIDALISKDRNPWPLFLFATFALFMFFFRKKMYEKMKNKQK